MSKCKMLKCKFASCANKIERKRKCSHRTILLMIFKLHLQFLKCTYTELDIIIFWSNLYLILQNIFETKIPTNKHFLQSNLYELYKDVPSLKIFKAFPVLNAL